MKKLLICQFYTPNLDYGIYSEKINRKYCEKFQIDYLCHNNQELIDSKINGRDHTWYKIPFLLEQLKKNIYEYVMYVDADAIFVKNDYDIQNILNAYSQYDLIASEDFNPHMKLNAGVLIFKNTEWSIKFLKKIWKCGSFILNGKYKNNFGHEQSIISILLSRYELDKNKTIILDRNGNNIINNNALQCGSTLIYHACSNQNCKNNLKNININNIYELGKAPINLRQELDLLYETERHYLSNYSYIYVYFINKILQTKKTINVLEIGGDTGLLFNIICRYYPNLKYYNFCQWPLYQKNNNMFRYYSEHVDEISIKKFKEHFSDIKYDIIISIYNDKPEARQLIFKEFFPLLNNKGIFMIENLQDSDGNLQKKWFSDLINQFKIYKTFNNDNNDFNHLSLNIKNAEIFIMPNQYFQLGIIYKK